jgi:hypothetical protein
MASFYINAKIGKKGYGEAHAAYIAREEKYDKGDRYEDMENKDSGNMPKWAEHNPSEFWKAADKYERANGSVFREIELALPREFSKEQRLELVKDFISQEIGDKHAYQFAIHNPKSAMDGGEQPHAHIMYSERIRDGINRDPEQYFKRHNAKNPEKGGAKKFSGGKNYYEMKDELLALRKSWADVQNKHLEKNGSPDRVDHRSFEEQGIDRVPEKHLGWKAKKDTPERKAVLNQREIYAQAPQNLQTFSEAQAIEKRYKYQSNALDYAAQIAKKFESGMDERAQAKQAAIDKAAADAEARQQEQARIEREKQAARLEQARIEQAKLEAAKPAPAPIQPKKPKSKDYDMEL